MHIAKMLLNEDEYKAEQIFPKDDATDIKQSPGWTQRIRKQNAMLRSTSDTQVLLSHPHKLVLIVI